MAPLPTATCSDSQLRLSVYCYRKRQLRQADHTRHTTADAAAAVVVVVATKPINLPREPISLPPGPSQPIGLAPLLLDVFSALEPHNLAARGVWPHNIAASSSRPPK